MHSIAAAPLTGLIAHVLLLPPWRGGRVAECTGLENRRRETVRGFKSHPLRQIKSPHSNECGLFLCCSAAQLGPRSRIGLMPSDQRSPVIRQIVGLPPSPEYHLSVTPHPCEAVSPTRWLALPCALFGVRGVQRKRGPLRHQAAPG